MSSRADLPLLLLRAASAVNEQINAVVVEREGVPLRPAHGLVVVRVARDGATVSEVAQFLGITKQSAAAIVDELVGWGYLAKRPHPRDGRAHLLRLTRRGTRLTATASDAAARGWTAVEAALGREPADALAAGLEHLGRDAPPRPVW